MTGQHAADRIKVWPVMGGRVSETVARPVRTTIHTSLAAVLVGLYSAHVHHLGRDEFATYVVLVAAVVNAVWVAVENRLERGLLREVPPKTVPVVDDKPTRGVSELVADAIKQYGRPIPADEET